MLRWIEHNVSMPSAQQGAANTAPGASQLYMHGGCWDQLLFTDVLLSAMGGKAVLWHCLRPSSGEGQRGSLAGGARAAAAAGVKEWDELHKKALGIEGTVRELFMTSTAQSDAGDEPMHQLVLARSFTLHWSEVGVPLQGSLALPDSKVGRGCLTCAWLPHVHVRLCMFVRAHACACAYVCVCAWVFVFVFARVCVCACALFGMDEWGRRAGDWGLGVGPPHAHTHHV